MKTRDLWVIGLSTRSAEWRKRIELSVIRFLELSVQILLHVLEHWEDSLIDRLIPRNTWFWFVNDGVGLFWLVNERVGWFWLVNVVSWAVTNTVIRIRGRPQITFASNTDESAFLLVDTMNTDLWLVDKMNTVFLLVDTMYTDLRFLSDCSRFMLNP